MATDTNNSGSGDQIVVLVENQATRVSQRVNLDRVTDCQSYMALLAALEVQLAPLLSADQDSAPERVPLPPESTNIFVLDNSIGTYLPLTDAQSLCDRARLLIDFVPPPPGSTAAAGRPSSASRPPSASSHHHALLPPTAPVINNQNQPRDNSDGYNNNNNNNNNNSNVPSGNNSRPPSRASEQHHLPREAAPTPVPPTPLGDSGIDQRAYPTAMSPLAVDPEVLLIESAAKLLGDLAALTIEQPHSSFVTAAVERRLARLPTVTQERAVGAWSRAIADGQARRAPNPLLQTLEQVMADRDRLVVSLREAKSELEALRQQSKSNKTNITYGLRNQKDSAVSMSTTSNVKNNNNNIASIRHDEEDDATPCLETPRAARMDDAQNREDQPQQRCESVTPYAAAAGGSGGKEGGRRWQEDEEDQEQQNNYKNQGEADPGQYVRDEIPEDDVVVSPDNSEAAAQREKADDDNNNRGGGVRSKSPSDAFVSTRSKQPPTGQAARQQQFQQRQGQQQQQQRSGEEESSSTPGWRDPTDPGPRQQQPQTTSTRVINNHVYSTTGGGTSSYKSHRTTDASHVYRDSSNRLRDDTPLPSARPLSATLRKIMTDTTEQKIERGSDSVFVSRLPPDSPDRSKPATRRVGCVYSDQSLRHLPGGTRGTKSFLVPDPVCVKDVVEATAAALLINPVNVAVGYWGSDGVTPVFIRDDSVLRKYLHDQPRVVPFVQAFIIAGSGGPHVTSSSSGSAAAAAVADQQYAPRRPVSAPTARPSTYQASRVSAVPAADGEAVATPSTAANNMALRRRGSGDASSGAAGNYNYHSKKESLCEYAADRIETINVTQSDASERGLEVLAPLPPESSKSSPWRLRVDCTPPPVHSAATTGGVMMAGGAQQQQQQQSQSSQQRHHHHHHANRGVGVPDAIMDPSSGWEPISRRPYRPQSAGSRLPSTSITWGGLGAPKSVVLFGGGVDEGAITELFQQLCEEAGTVGEGVPPAVLLSYLDANFDNMGDRRRFERMIGAYWSRPRMSLNEVMLVLLRLAKE